jgi:hypothetical protein
LLDPDARAKEFCSSEPAEILCVRSRMEEEEGRERTGMYWIRIFWTADVALRELRIAFYLHTRGTLACRKSENVLETGRYGRLRFSMILVGHHDTCH